MLRERHESRETCALMEQVSTRQSCGGPITMGPSPGVSVKELRQATGFQSHSQSVTHGPCAIGVECTVRRWAGYRARVLWLVGRRTRLVSTGRKRLRVLAQ